MRRFGFLAVKPRSSSGPKPCPTWEDQFGARNWSRRFGRRHPPRTQKMELQPNIRRAQSEFMHQTLPAPVDRLTAQLPQMFFIPAKWISPQNGETPWANR